MRKMIVSADLLLVFGLGLSVWGCRSHSADQNAEHSAQKSLAVTDSAPAVTYSVVLPTETELRQTTSVPAAFAVYKILSAQLLTFRREVHRPRGISPGLARHGSFREGTGFTGRQFTTAVNLIYLF